MKTNTKFKTLDLILCALFAALIVVGAFIKIPIPVVPFTLQLLFVNLAGLFLGSRLGATSAAIYMILGLVGLPVFAQGGGIGYIFQPSFGYIIAFIFGAYACGLIVEKSKQQNIKTFLLASFANLIIVYLIGMIYYYFMSNYYLGNPIAVKVLIIHCFILVVPGDIVLSILSAILRLRLDPILKKQRTY